MLIILSILESCNLYKIIKNYSLGIPNGEKATIESRQFISQDSISVGILSVVDHTAVRMFFLGCKCFSGINYS